MLGFYKMINFGVVSVTLLHRAFFLLLLLKSKKNLFPRDRFVPFCRLSSVIRPTWARVLEIWSTGCWNTTRCTDFPSKESWLITGLWKTPPRSRLLSLEPLKSLREHAVWLQHKLWIWDAEMAVVPEPGWLFPHVLLSSFPPSFLPVNIYVFRIMKMYLFLLETINLFLNVACNKGGSWSS